MKIINNDNIEVYSELTRTIRFSIIITKKENICDCCNRYNKLLVYKNDKKALKNNKTDHLMGDFFKFCEQNIDITTRYHGEEGKKIINSLKPYLVDVEYKKIINILNSNEDIYFEIDFSY